MHCAPRRGGVVGEHGGAIPAVVSNQADEGNVPCAEELFGCAFQGQTHSRGARLPWRETENGGIQKNASIGCIIAFTESECGDISV